MWRLILAGAAWRRRRLVMGALAIVLGVAFVSGTLVLSQSVRHAYDRLLTQVTAGVDVYVRGPETDRLQGISDFAPVPSSLVQQLRSVPGVAAAQGQVVRLAALVDRSGRFLGTDHPTYGYSWLPDAAHAPFVVVAGRAPRGPGEFALDQASAHAYSLKVGDRLRVSLDVASPQPATLVGLVAPRVGGNLASSTAVFLAPGWAQQLAGIGAQWDLVELSAAHGVTPDVLRDRVAAVLPRDGTSAITSREYADAEVQQLSARSDSVTTILLALSVLALLVAAGVVLETHRIVVLQRTRELAMLRIVGASPRQVAALVIGEAAFVGALAACAGALLGVPVSLLLRAIVGLTGQSAAPAPVDVDPLTLGIAAAAGAVTSTAIAAYPAMQAARLPLLAAVRRVAPAASRPGLGARALRAAVRGGGGWLSRLGAPGLVTRSSMLRDPRRSIAAAAPVAAGIALITCVSVLTASTDASITALVQRVDRADLVVTSDAAPGIDPEAVSKLREAPDIAVVSEMGAESFTVNERADLVTAIEPETAPKVLTLPVVAGHVSALSLDSILVTQSAALAGGYHVGDVVYARFAEPQVYPLRIAAIIGDNAITRNWVISWDLYGRGYHIATIRAAFVRAAPGVSARQLRADVSFGVNGFPGVQVQDAASFARSQTQALQGPLGLIEALLGLSILVAVLGVMNTMGLSVFERSHELGLLRLIGMSSRQVSSTVYLEAGITTLVGVITGVAAGLAIGVAIVAALNVQGTVDIAVPWLGLLALSALVIAAGLAAALLPATRAARTGLVEAVADQG